MNKADLKQRHRVLLPALAIFCICSLGCSKFLDLKPQSEMTDPAYWKTNNDFQLAANWFYANALDDPGYDDNMSDISFGTGVDVVSSGSNVAPEEDSRWDNAYRNIRNANKLIMQGELSPIKNDIAAFLGEGYFFRAYDYFKLVKLFGDVPIISKVLQQTDREIYNARSLRSVVIDSVLADLDRAIGYLPVKSVALKGRICKEAAQAFKARACLFEGSWRKYHASGNPSPLLTQAITASKKVIESKAYSLYRNKGEDSYRYLFIDRTSEDNVESILTKRYRLNINPNGWIYGVSWGNLNPTKKMADMYLCSDGLPVNKSALFKGYDSCRTEYYNRDPRMLQSLILPAKSIIRPQYDAARPQWPGVDNNRNVNSGYMLYKFISEITTPGPNGTGAFDWHVMRFAEVLLIYAEALLERDGSISDADLNISVNALRDRAGMPHLTNVFVQSNGMDMKTELRRERAVELAFEGFRWDDLRRWKIAETELPPSVLSIKVTGTQWSNPTIIIDGNNYASKFYNMPANQLENGFKLLQPGSQRSFSQKNYLLPLPTKQILLNRQLKQNPGW